MISYMSKYPYASAYIMGLLDITPAALEAIRDLEFEKHLCELEILIFDHHKKWRLDEMYYRGLDMSEVIHDLNKNAEPGILNKESYIKQICEKTKQDINVVRKLNPLSVAMKRAITNKQV